MAEHAEDEHIPETSRERHELAHLVHQKVRVVRRRDVTLAIHRVHADIIAADGGVAVHVQGNELERHVTHEEGDEQREGEDDDGGGGAIGPPGGARVPTATPEDREEEGRGEEREEEGDEEVQHHENVHQLLKARGGETHVRAAVVLHEGRRRRR